MPGETPGLLSCAKRIGIPPISASAEGLALAGHRGVASAENRGDSIPQLFPLRKAALKRLAVASRTPSAYTSPSTPTTSAVASPISSPSRSSRGIPITPRERHLHTTGRPNPDFCTPLRSRVQASIPHQARCRTVERVRAVLVEQRRSSCSRDTLHVEFVCCNVTRPRTCSTP